MTVKSLSTNVTLYYSKYKPSNIYDLNVLNVGDTLKIRRTEVYYLVGVNIDNLRDMTYEISYGNFEIVNKTDFETINKTGIAGVLLEGHILKLSLTAFFLGLLF